MTKLTICFTFSGGKGHAYVNIIPSNYGIYKQDFSGCHDFQLPAGTYSILIDGVSPSGGSTDISVTADSQATQTQTISTTGYFSTSFTVIIP